MAKDGLDKDQKYIVDQIKQQLPSVKKLPEPDRSRYLVSLAYEYFLQDMEEDAFKLIEMADPNYFKGQMSKDMGTVEGFDKIVTVIMSKLLELGYFVDPKEKKKK